VRRPQPSSPSCGASRANAASFWLPMKSKPDSGAPDDSLHASITGFSRPITVAKSLAAAPLAAVVGRAEIMDAPEPGGLGGTFAGNPVACAAALAILEIMDEGFLRGRATSGPHRVRAAFHAGEIQRDPRRSRTGSDMAMSYPTAPKRSLKRLAGADFSCCWPETATSFDTRSAVVSDAELDEGFTILEAATAEAYAV